MCYDKAEFHNFITVKEYFLYLVSKGGKGASIGGKTLLSII